MVQTHRQSIWRHLIWTNQGHCPPPPFPHIFYRPDALPATQPTVSKHWRQIAVNASSDIFSRCKTKFVNSVENSCQCINWWKILFVNKSPDLNTCRSIFHAGNAVYKFCFTSSNTHTQPFYGPISGSMVNDWCTTVCRMTRSKVKVKVTTAWKPLKRSRPSVQHRTNFYYYYYY